MIPLALVRTFLAPVGAEVVAFARTTLGQILIALSLLYVGWLWTANHYYAEGVATEKAAEVVAQREADALASALEKKKAKEIDAAAVTARQHSALEIERLEEALKAEEKKNAVPQVAAVVEEPQVVQPPVKVGKCPSPATDVIDGRWLRCFRNPGLAECRRR